MVAGLVVVPDLGISSIVFQVPVKTGTTIRPYVVVVSHYHLGRGTCESTTELLRIMVTSVKKTLAIAI